MTELPAGWTVDEETEADKLKSHLPEGWKVESVPSTPKERDEAKLKKEAGIFAAPEKTPEELKKMSVSEKRQYIEELAREREYLQSGQFTKSAVSGATFGLSENIEALKPIEFEETNPYSIIGTGGHVAGSLIPLSKMINIAKGPAMKLASKSPVFQKQISSLLTMFGVGASSKALETIAKGEVPEAEELLEHGIEWAALDALLQTAGVAGKFASSLLNRSKATGVGRKDLVNSVYRELAESGVDMTNAEAVSAKALEILEKPVTEAEIAAAKRLQLAEQAESPVTNIAQEAMEQQPITPKELKSRKITDESVNKITSDSAILSEPYELEGLNFTQEAETLAKDAIEEQIESTGTRAASEEELGNSIREDIEERLEAAKSEYKPLYREAEEAAENILHTPENTGREAGDKLIKMSKLKTKPAGYSSVLSNLENILEDAGYVIQRDEEGVIEHILQDKEVPVQQTMELARRLNEIINYEAVEPSVKDALKSVVKGAKTDIRVGLRQNPDALAAFELAEAEHARVASKFSKDSIRKIRGNQAGEKISKMAEAPSTLGDLREVLSPQQMLQLEREMLEKLNSQNFEKARKSLREIEKHLSAENRKLAREIVEAKNPHNPLARKRIAQEAILNDMSTALTNGARPEKTLGLWKTPKGQKLVKETFHNSPNWPQVKTYLEKQSFNDMVSSILEDGKVDLKKFKGFMKDHATINNIRSQGGEEAVTFFKELDGKVKQLQDNARVFEKLPTKEQIERGKKFLKQSPGQRRLQEGVDKSRRIEKTTEKIGQREIRPTEKIDKGHFAAREKRGKAILERMARKDYPVQSKINDWKAWVKDALGLNAQAAMSVFGMAKLGGATVGAFTLGVPSTVATMIGYKFMNKMLTSPRARKAFLEAAKHHYNPLIFISAIEQLGDVIDEED